MASRGEEEIKLFLKKHDLEEYYDSIINLKVHTVNQLQDISERKLKRMEMNEVERTRFLREAKEAGKNPKHPTSPYVCPPSMESENSMCQVKELNASKNATKLKNAISTDKFTMISANSKNLKKELDTKKFNQIYDKIIVPIALHHLKCGLQFDSLLTNWFNITQFLPRNNASIFHSIFQQSEPLVKALCIYYYSVYFPVPFYYPLLDSVNEHTNSVQFKICQELWFSFPNCLTIASFGLGNAAWSPVGKSKFLNFFFKTDFVSRKDSKSAYNKNSIDVQILNHEGGPKVAIFDCHSRVSPNVIRILSKYVNYLLIHVLHENFEEDLFAKELETFSRSSKHIVLIRDSNIHNIPLDNTKKFPQNVYVPNLKEDNDTNNNRELLIEIFGNIFMDKEVETVDQSLIENMMRDLGQSEFLDIIGDLKTKIIDIKDIVGPLAPEGASREDFLKFYPKFKEYMALYHKINRSTDLGVAKLNKDRASLLKKIGGFRTSRVIHHFVQLFHTTQQNDNPYSLFLLRSFSEFLKIKSTETNPYSIDVMWREALLSYKYDRSRSNDDNKKFTLDLQRCLCKQLMDGEPFQLIDGDNLVFHSKDIDILLQKYYEEQDKILKRYNAGKNVELGASPIVISILGQQDTGKSTLLNFLFGCRFMSQAGPCTRGVYGSFFQLDECINNSKTLLILDTEGLNTIRRESSEDSSLVNFDRTLALFCLAVSQIVIVNIVGDISVEQKNLLEVCAYSLNRLKVNKVTLPKIIFVFNQRKDQNANTYATSMKYLMESLKIPIYGSYNETTNVSDLIEISAEDLIVLPKAFNSSTFSSPFCRVTVEKSEIYQSFFVECGKFKGKIFELIRSRAIDTRPPFKNVSEWMQMAGVVWETCSKYQDIVKYPKVEELEYSLKLSKIMHELMQAEIYEKHSSLLAELDNIFREIKLKEDVFEPEQIFNDKIENFMLKYNMFKDECQRKFNKHSKDSINIALFKFACEQADANLDTLIQNNLKGYEDKLKSRIKFLLTELKLAKSTKTFKNMIEPRLDECIKMETEQKVETFTKIWKNCFVYKYEDDSEMRERYLKMLYQNFKMECIYIDYFNDILACFQEKKFEMDGIIKEKEDTILQGLKLRLFREDDPESWYFCTQNETYGGFTEVRPHSMRGSCSYLTPDSIIELDPDDKSKSSDLVIHEWIPKELHPIIESLSGKFDAHNINWGERPERFQILQLVSMLKSPKNPKISCWVTLMKEVKNHAEFNLKQDPELSQTTVTKLVRNLKMSTRVVNHEIRYIRAMLSQRAERAFTTLLFSYAFKVYWGHQEKQIRLNEQSYEARKTLHEKYFLQKIANRRMFIGTWNNENTLSNDIQISNTFASSYIESIKRLILNKIYSQVEKRFEREKESITVKKLIETADVSIDEHVTECNDDEITDTHHFVVRFICNRNVCLEELYHQLFGELEERFYCEIHDESKRMFKQYIYPLENQFLLLQKYLQDHLIQATGSQCSHYNFKPCESSDSVCSREAPHRATMLYLSKYLNPEISDLDFSKFFKNVFEVNKIQVGRSENYNLPEERLGDLCIEEFKRLESTDIFYKDIIFDILTFIDNFRTVLLTEERNFSLDSEFTHQLFQHLRSHYLKDALGCEMRCPSCGKFCEKRIHNDGSKCQIFSGHQLSSMGGKVWKSDTKHSAVIFLCDDYQDYMNITLSDRSMKWKNFKFQSQKEWNWDEQNYKTTKEAHRVRMQNIWRIFGKGILNYYAKQGIHISYTPISRFEMESLATNYFICFVIDGTGSMAEDIERARLSVSKLAVEYKKRAFESKFRVIIYRDHCDNRLIEKCPNDATFTKDSDDIVTFLEGVKAEGGQDGPEAMLDGLAEAVINTNWINEFSSRNILVHIYDGPPHGLFPAYKDHSEDSDKAHCCCCNRTQCRYDWDEHVWNPMKDLNIFYHGINTFHRPYEDFEATMKMKLGELCDKFQICGKEQVDEAVLQIFVAQNI